MAIFDWISRVRGQQAPWGDGNGGLRDTLPPKFLEPTIISVPGTPFPETPSTELATPTESEKGLALEKLPEEFGRLASWRGALILLVTSGSQFLDNVFMTSSNMALASIQEEFDVSTTNLQWMISAYTLTFGGFLLLAGALSDR